ncbi:MAG: hypothetical protein M3R29_01965 [Verrucomicrobiota bacterium]|nr:hypothetical protein [Verrucomicrobiota bacterium]
MFGLLAVEIIIIFWVSLKRPLGWDGLLDWEIKAHYAFLSDNVMPADYFHSGRIFSHPEYPLAIPLTELWLYVWMGEAHQFWVKTIFPIFYAAGALLLACLSARLTGKRWAGYVAALLLFFVPQMTVRVGGATLGYVDFPISVVYLAVVGYLLLTLASNSGNFRIYAACLALLPWLKREGAVLWLVAAMAGVVVILVRRRSRRQLFALLPGLLIIIGWAVYLRAMQATPPEEFAPLSLAGFSANVGRLIPIWQRMLFHMADPDDWSIFWLLSAVAITYLIVRVRNLQCAILLGAIILPIVIYCSIYIFSTWPPYLHHVSSSLPRLLMHVVPILWIAIAMSFSTPFRLKTATAPAGAESHDRQTQQALGCGREPPTKTIALAGRSPTNVRINRLAL